MHLCRGRSRAEGQAVRGRVRTTSLILLADVFLLVSLSGKGHGASGEWRMTPLLQTDPASVAGLLREAGVWLLPQPKEAAVSQGTFNIVECKGIRIGGAASPSGAEVLSDLPRLLKERSGVELDMTLGEREAGCISFGVFPDGIPPAGFTGITAAELEAIGCQGYVLVIDIGGVTAAARETEGLYYAGRALAQIATDRTELPCLKVRDWPSLRYRGVQQDISRGQIPTMATFKRLVRVLAEAKINLLELYIQNTFKWEKHPGISPPEAVTPAEARALFDYAARFRMEVAPFLQVLGHSGGILRTSGYERFRVRDVPEKPWTVTFDPRKGETVAFMNDLVRELCEALPGEFFNIDTNEIDVEGFNATGTKTEDLPRLVYEYVLKIRDVVRPHGKRLRSVQAQLDGVGHRNGFGFALDRIPSDVVLGMYYGTMRGNWETDFPRLKEHNRAFFAQAWIASHSRLMPWVGYAADFSDNEIERGLEHGAIGSTTCDWGDAGNFHLTGQTWYPFLYHGASAWTGAKVDRAYFDEAFCRLLYGTKDDGVARAIRLAGNINGQDLMVHDESGRLVRGHTTHFWEFFNDPFTDKRITAIADPGAKGAEILEPADEAVLLLKEALTEATRNRDNIEQLLFGARCYQAMGRKLIVAGHYLDASYPRDELISELEDLISTYIELQSEFERLWLAEDRENDHLHNMVGRFSNTIIPCQQRIAQLKEAAKQ